MNREAGAKYKQALDKLLPPEGTEAVYTENAADTIDNAWVEAFLVRLDHHRWH